MDKAATIRHEHLSGENQRRVESFRVALRTRDSGDGEDGVTDMLTDAMHFCAAEGISFEGAMDRAVGHYEVEA